MRQPGTVAVASVGQLFQSLVLTAPTRNGRRASATVGLSMALHSALAAAVVTVPLLLSSTMPPVETITTFFAAPLEITVAPPPPPPALGHNAGARVPRPAAAVQAGFVAPIDIPTDIKPEDSLGPDGPGDPNGVEGGVPDGVVGAIVRGLPAAPPPPPRVVRISQLSQPKPIVRVEPRYPELAVQTGVSASVQLEAEVDTAGRVTTVKVLRGHPLLDAAAVEAVRQWRYQPLLLNGEPTAFILTVTVDFRTRRV